MLSTRSYHDPSTAVIVAQLISFLWATLVGPLAILLLLVSEFGRGRLFAATALLTAILPLAATLAVRSRERRWVRAALGGFGVWFGLVVVLLALVPKGVARPGAKVMHGLPHNEQTSRRYSLGNLLPECDQLLFGFTLMPLVDPLLTTTQASKLKLMTASLYRELERDPDFHALGSVMSDAYRELFGIAWPTGHANAEFRAPGSGGARSGHASHSYVYLPSALDRGQPNPVLIFFHGSGGNFKAYLWILSKLADRLGFALVAPSGGLGDWTTAESRRALDHALASVSHVATIDRTRIHILGLSNGGLAISQLAASQGSQFASMVFLSPVFAVPEIHSSSFVEQCRDRRILVVTGGRDDRIPIGYVDENTRQITKAGALLTRERFETADHFLMFSHREQLLPLLEEWFRKARP